MYMAGRCRKCSSCSTSRAIVTSWRIRSIPRPLWPHAVRIAERCRIAALNHGPWVRRVTGLFVAPVGGIFEQSDDRARIHVFPLARSVEGVHLHPATDLGVGACLNQQLGH